MPEREARDRGGVVTGGAEYPWQRAVGQWRVESPARAPRAQLGRNSAVTSYPISDAVHAGDERRAARQTGHVRRIDAPESQTGIGQSIDVRRCRPVVSVATQVIRPQTVDVHVENPHRALRYPGCDHLIAVRCAIIAGVAYDTLVALHVISAVVGFGAVAISGVYGAIARNSQGGGATEETARYFRSPGRAEWLVLAVPFLGAAALAARPGDDRFGAVWVLAAAAVWLLASIILLAVVRPAERQIRTAQPGGTGLVTGGRRLMWAAVAMDPKTKPR